MILVGVDADTKMLLSAPLDSKGADLRGQAEHVKNYGNTEIIGDSEPTMKHC